MVGETTSTDGVKENSFWTACWIFPLITFIWLILKKMIQHSLKKNWLCTPEPSFRWTSQLGYNLQTRDRRYLVIGHTTSGSWWEQPSLWMTWFSPGIIRYSFTYLERMEGWVGLAVWGDREIYWYDLHEESNPGHSHGSTMVNYYAPVDFKIHCHNLFSSNRLGKIALLCSCVLYLKTKVEWKCLHNQGLIRMLFFFYIS